MQSEYEYQKLKDKIPMANVISFSEWVTLRQHGNITKGIAGFLDEELDESVIFFDDKMEYLDYLERKKVENITPSFVLVPRFFWEDKRENIPEEFLPSIRIQDRIKILDTRREYWSTLQARALAEIDTIKCKATPRPEQEPVIDFFREEMQSNQNIRGVLQAPPGAGKTIMSLMIASRYRARTLIIVPNQVLQDQWYDAILDATELTPDNIGVIQGSDLKKIEEEIFSLEHVDTKVICIVKIQSLYSQIKHNHLMTTQNMYRSIDLVFYDEAHNSGAATSYAKTSSLFLTPNIIGLTATPYRQGLNDYLLRTSIGETIYKLEHNNLTPDVEIHNIWTEFTTKENTRLNGARGDYIIFLGIFNSLMKDKYTYFEYMADMVAWNISQGYNIVVLFPTIHMQELLQHNIQRRHPTLVDTVLLLKGKTKQDTLDLVKEERKILMGNFKEYKDSLNLRVKDKEIKRKEANELVKARRAEIDSKITFLKEHSLDLYKRKIKEASVIVSNYNLLQSGFDKPQMSNLILGGAPRIGKISVIQSIGRITRVHEGKKHPLVQFFIPSKFIEIQKSTGVILAKNIRVQYPDAQFKYVGFQ